jgi:hypothetical protein
MGNPTCQDLMGSPDFPNRDSILVKADLMEVPQVLDNQVSMVDNQDLLVDNLECLVNKDFPDNLGDFPVSFSPL